MADAPWDKSASSTEQPTCGPAFWKMKKRPVVTDQSPHDLKVKQIAWDALFAGAASTGHWEDEWPLMTEAKFEKSLKKVATLELGGHNPNGTHPRAPSAE